MSTVQAKNGVSIYYKDWGAGMPIVFAHAWPLSADSWDEQMLFLGLQGFRVIAYDRRGFGRSEQTWDGNDMNTYADDLHELMEKLDLRGAVLVGHSAGGGEVVRYMSRHGSNRVAKVVLIAAAPPIRIKNDLNPNGVSMEVFDQMRAGIQGHRTDFFRETGRAFLGYNRTSATVSEGILDEFWRQSMLGGIKAQYDCIKAFSETDFTEDLERLNMPLLLLHGDDDQMISLENSSQLTAQIVKGAELKIYKGGSHGLPMINADRVNQDLLTFLRQP